MSSQFQINETVTSIFPGGYQTAVLVYNPGSNAQTIYVGKDTTVSASTGLALAPGTSVEWDPSTPLYAISPNAVETLTVDTDATNLTSALDVATALINSGLPADIAAQIALSGAPSIDAPLTVPMDGTWFDVTKYSSLRIKVKVTCGTGDTAVGDLWECNISSQDAAGNQVLYDVVTGQSTGVGIIDVSTFGSKMSITVNMLANPSGSVYAFTGSAANLSYRESLNSVHVNNDYWSNSVVPALLFDGNAIATFTAPNGVVTSLYPPYRRGLNTIELYSPVTGGTVTNYVEVVDAYTTNPMAHFAFSTAAIAESPRLINIRQQPRVDYHNVATSGSYRLSYAQTAA